MKQNEYKIVWVNEHLSDTYIYASSTEQARILAQAEKIKAGLEYRVEYVDLCEEGDIIEHNGEIFILKIVD